MFPVGNKVTQLRNNYDKGAAGVFNGTTGVVTRMSLEDHSLTVRTDEDEELAYDFDELDELAHAYAVTIHRSQGSEYPAVVIPLTTSAWMMLQRNLLYTGITRAKKLVVLAGSRRALAKAVRTAGARPPPHRASAPPPDRLKAASASGWPGRGVPFRLVPVMRRRRLRQAGAATSRGAPLGAAWTAAGAAREGAGRRSPGRAVHDSVRVRLDPRHHRPHADPRRRPLSRLEG